MTRRQTYQRSGREYVEVENNKEMQLTAICFDTPSKIKGFTFVVYLWLCLQKYVFFLFCFEFGIFFCIEIFRGKYFWNKFCGFFVDFFLVAGSIFLRVEEIAIGCIFFLFCADTILCVLNNFSGLFLQRNFVQSEFFFSDFLH